MYVNGRILIAVVVGVFKQIVEDTLHLFYVTRNGQIWLDVHLTVHAFFMEHQFKFEDQLFQHKRKVYL